MDTQMRPMSLGEILDRTAQLYRTNFLLFAGIAAVYAGALMVLGLVRIGLDALLGAMHWAQLVLWLNIGTVLLQWAVIFLIGGLAIAANNRAVAWVHLGQRATIRGAYMSVVPRLGRILWLMTIITFVVWTPLALCYGGFASLAFFWYKPLAKAGGGQANQQATILFGIMALIFFAVAFLALVYAVLMGLRYALAIPVCVVEDLKARTALRRSIDLSLGSRGRIFVLGLLVAVIEIALVGITQSFFIFLAFKNHLVLPTWAAVAQQIVSFATTSFIAPMFSTGLTLFYYDQRVRMEGYDIEWMMQAAGMNAGLYAAAAPLEPLVSAAPVESVAETLPIEANGAERQAHGEQP
ncbi:hypothetical protein [Terracidiphilus sp.]|jgi:hypothetical protein|uniref:hypothetical protein n=1 Tax=Terracidiphilus sp. TaxID=1964191 RepID=UPI003C1E069B